MECQRSRVEAHSNMITANRQLLRCVVVNLKNIYDDNCSRLFHELSSSTNGISAIIKLATASIVNSEDIPWRVASY